MKTRAPFAASPFGGGDGLQGNAGRGSATRSRTLALPGAAFRVVVFPDPAAEQRELRGQHGDARGGEVDELAVDGDHAGVGLGARQREELELLHLDVLYAAGVGVLAALEVEEGEEQRDAPRSLCT